MRHGRRSGHGGGSRAYDTDVPVQFVRKEFANGTQRRPWTEFLFPSLSLSLSGSINSYSRVRVYPYTSIYRVCVCAVGSQTNKQTIVIALIAGRSFHFPNAAIRARAQTERNRSPPPGAAQNHRNNPQTSINIRSKTTVLLPYVDGSRPMSTKRRHNA